MRRADYVSLIFWTFENSAPVDRRVKLRVGARRETTSLFSVAVSDTYSVFVRIPEWPGFFPEAWKANSRRAGDGE